MELAKLQVIVCAGTGGVGKTTIAASLGASLAMAGRRTLVLTIDPARRLAQALGIEGRMEQDVCVQNDKLGGRLFATMIDPRSVFDRFVKKAAPDPLIAERLIRNRLYQQLVTSLSGSQEFTSLERVLSALETGEYDVLVLDTPPSQNAVEFLRAPERMFSLFQESVTRWFSTESSENSKGFIASLISRGTRTVFSALERITGSQFIGELRDFFQQMSYLQSQVRERSQAVHRLLTSESTGFVLVTGFDETKLREALEFQDDLKNQGYRLVATVINRCFPDWTMNHTDEALGDSSDPKVKALQEYYQLMRRQFAHRLELAEKMEEKMPGVPLIRVPETKTSPQGIEDLLQLSHLLDRLVEAPQ